MMTSLLVLSFTLPLLCVLAVLTNRQGIWMLLAPTPALLAALLLPAHGRLELPWLLLGTTLGLDPITRGFLLFTALLWLAATLALIRAPLPNAQRRFQVCFLLAMSGNFLLLVGQDMLSFYLGFTLMGLSAYGLVVHSGSDSARRAGRVYLVMTVLAEMALFAGLVLLYQTTASLVMTPALLAGVADPTGFWLISLAMAVKAGVFGVHVWLPLAHPAAPIPASAVLSGAMIKTALVGWLRFTPIGVSPLEPLGMTLCLLGGLGVVFTLLFGVVQTNPKVVLAYASVGKMGALVSLVGLMLLEPELAPAGSVLLMLFAAHHGLLKGSLFLSLGAPSMRGLWLVWLIPALLMLGPPGTPGAEIKAQIKQWLGSADTTWSGYLVLLLAISAVGSAWLMARFCYLAQHRQAPASGSALPAWLLVGAAMGLHIMLPGVYLAPQAFLWPGLALLVAAWVVVQKPAALASWVGTIAPGDLLNALPAIRRLPTRSLRTRTKHLVNTLGSRFRFDSSRKELPFSVASLIWLGVLLLLFTSLHATS